MPAYLSSHTRDSASFVIFDRHLHLLSRWCLGEDNRPTEMKEYLFRSK